MRSGWLFFDAALWLLWRGFCALIGAAMIAGLAPITDRVLLDQDRRLWKVHD
jgi:hypothetical protein